MANAEHVLLVKQGREKLEQWATENPGSGFDLSGADLRNVDLVGVSLLDTFVDFQRADLREAALDHALFGEAIFSGADLRRASFHETYLVGADMQGADFREAWLMNTDFTEANLTEADFRGTSLKGTHFQFAELIQADMSDSKLEWADLGEANLKRANLRGATLFRVQASAADFSYACLTGACVADWKTNCDTRLEGVVCDYIYLKENNQERRPRSGIFKAEEFTALFRQVQDTIDLIFVDGIDWKAFFITFQQLCEKYHRDELNVQAIERKSGSSFIVRLKVANSADRSAIESAMKSEYETQQRLLRSQYEERLLLQGRHLQDVRSTIEAERRKNATLMGVVTSMASNQKVPKYDLRGAQFAGGMAETVQGDQVGGTINNYGAKLEDIAPLLSTLREQAQAFPDEYREDTLDTIDDLEMDIKQASPNQNRIGRRLKRLVAAATAAGAITGGAATFSGDMKDFANNVVELTEVLDLPIEFMQPHLSDK